MREVPSEKYIEGEPTSTKPTAGTPFDCLFLVIRGGREQGVPKGTRTISQPVILFEPFDINGADFRLKASDKVLIRAEEHFGDEAVLFQVDGPPTSMAKPGFMVGYEATLKRVDD